MGEHPTHYPRCPICGGRTCAGHGDAPAPAGRAVEVVRPVPAIVLEAKARGYDTAAEMLAAELERVRTDLDELRERLSALQDGAGAFSTRARVLEDRVDALEAARKHK